MKLTLTDLDGMVHKLDKSAVGEETAVTTLTCPHCGEENIDIAGTGKRFDPDNSYDTYRADAVHAADSCGKMIGVLRAKTETLFGIEEDEAVFRMGTKLY